MTVRSQGRALGDGQLRPGGGEVGDDGGGLRGPDDGRARRGGAAWRDQRALGHLAARGVLGVGHHHARVVHVLVVTAPVGQSGSQAGSQSVRQAVRLSVRQASRQSVRRTVSQSGSQAGRQSVRRTVSQSGSQAVGQLVS